MLQIYDHCKRCSKFFLDALKHIWYWCCIEWHTFSTIAYLKRILLLQQFLLLNFQTITCVFHKQVLKNPRGKNQLGTNLVIMIIMWLVIVINPVPGKVTCRCVLICAKMCRSSIMLKSNTSMKGKGTSFSMSGRNSCKNAR